MIIGYLRVSTGKQNPENQKDEIWRYLEEKNSRVDQWIVETVSGKVSFRKRKLGRLVRKMQKGDWLIVTEISRLSRSLVELMEIMGACVEKGISLYTTKEHYSFDNTINSKVLCFAFGLVAEIERNLISMRTREALALKKAEGVRLGRRPGRTDDPGTEFRGDCYICNNVNDNESDDAKRVIGQNVPHCRNDNDHINAGGSLQQEQWPGKTGRQYRADDRAGRKRLRGPGQFWK